jgi:hypothetical protein
MKIETTLDQMRSPGDYDWRYVFAYADGDQASPSFVPPTPGKDGERFGLDDVAEVVASVEGENDGPNWAAIVRLRSGKHAYVEAGCDYAGWG